jgi:hypothetical protein
MQSRLSTHSPDGSVAEDDVLVCEDCELSPLVLVLVLVVVVVLVLVLVSVVVVPAVDEEVVCPVVVPVVDDAVPVVPPVPAATDADRLPCDCEAAVAAGVGAVAESVRTDDRVVVDAESAARRCEASFVEGVAVDACCALAGVDAGRESSEAGSSAAPMDRLSGEVAASVRVLDCWFIAETVRPPPTRATAVATTALRWFFFQRARWRRRAARPSVATGASVTSADGRPGSVPGTGSSWRPESCHVGASPHAAAAEPVAAWTWAGGAMSGA